MLRRGLLILLVAVVVLGAVWYMRLCRYATWERSRSATCISNVKQVMNVMREYAADYDDHWPNALTWAQDPTSGPYGLHPVALVCPQERRDPINDEIYMTDRISYAMLQSRSYRPLSDPEPERLIVLYEIDKYGPAYRHNDGMNIGHAAGHAKWYSSDRMTPDIILSGVAPPPPSP